MKLWIARDKYGSLHLFKNMGGWYIGEIERNLFPEVTFENSPQQIEIKLV